MSNVSRRGFLGTAAGAASGMAAMGSANASSKRKHGKVPGLREDVHELVQKTRIVDTHEHLWPERTRIEASRTPNPKVAAHDFGMLLCHYADSDLQVAGLSGEGYKKLVSHDMSVADKWKLVKPYYERCKNTGYLLCARETARILFGVDDINDGTVALISDRLAAGVKPGFYRHVLRDVANIEYCHINTLDVPVFDKDEPDPELLAQDISTVLLSTGLGFESLSKLTGKPVTSLPEFHEAIDWCFDTFGPRAIATKNQCAYGRSLNFAEVSDEEAAPLAERRAKDIKALNDDEVKALQDHLMHYCINKAAENGLPVKLHTGYLAGFNNMRLDRLRENPSDLCSLVKKHRNAKFVLMHIAYPYQDEVIALAKADDNVYIDMCWAWVINPAASVRFLKEFLMAAPASKVLPFGGDYRPVESVVGHAAIARKGIARAISELVEEQWLDENDVPDLVVRLMQGNAHELFPYERALKNWKS